MISIIGFPNYLGQKLLSNLNTPLQVVKYLGIPTSSFYDLSTQLTSNLFTNLKILFQTNQKIKTPRVNIGGDHSMAIASVADSLQKYPNVKVIWVDAHPDINTQDSSTTQNFHGMPLSFLSGLDHHPDVNFISHKLNLKNLAYVGIRDIDEYERKVLETQNIEYFPVVSCENDVEKVIQDLELWIDGSPIHISWDVDSLDPEVIDSTGTPVSGGISLENGKKIFDFLLTQNWVNMDITEMNLNLGNPEKSLLNLQILLGKLTPKLKRTNHIAKL